MSPKRPNQNYPIRPAPPREVLSLGRHGAAGIIGSPPIAVPAKRRGPQTTLACDACRTRKTKCDGRKPCEACRSKNSQCHYDKEGRERNKTSALRSQVADLRAIVKRFSDGSDDEVAEIRRRLRENGDYSRIVKDLCSDAIQFDTTESERSTSPESLHPVPQQLPSIDFLGLVQKNSACELWRTPTKLELFRIARERAMLDSVSSDVDEDSGELNFKISIPRACSFSTAFQQIPFVRSPDLRLHGVFQFRPVKTTTPYLVANPPFNAPVSPAYTSRLLCLWLSYHAFCNPYIQPSVLTSMFVADESPRDGCEVLLQNSVLALSCLYIPQSTPSEYASHIETARYFLPEAERIWRSEKGRVTIPSIQALVAQYEYEKMLGRDRIGWHSLSIAMDMAQDMGLHSVHSDWSRIGIDDQVAYAAWGLFNHQAVESLTFCKPPLVLRCWTPRPSRIIPTKVIDSWQPYCLSDETSNSSFWDHWEALCNIAEISVDAAYVLYGDQIDGFEVPSRILVAQTQHSRYRLNEWRRRLPETLSLSNNESPHNIWLHMVYYNLMIALHRPYVDDSRISAEEPRDVVLHSRNIMIEAARNIIRLAMISLERYTPDFSSAHNIQMVATAAFILIQDLDDGASRSDLLSALSILRLQSVRFPLAAALTRAILMAARASALPDSKAYEELSNALRENLGATRITHVAEHVHSNFPTFVSFASGQSRKRHNAYRRAGGCGLSELLAALEEQELEGGSLT